MLNCSQHASVLDYKPTFLLLASKFVSLLQGVKSNPVFNSKLWFIGLMFEISLHFEFQHFPISFFCWGRCSSKPFSSQFCMD